MSGLFSKPAVQQAPTPVEIQQPVVNQEIVDRQAADIMARRRGSAATITNASTTGTTAGNVGSAAATSSQAVKSLLGQ